MDTVSTPQSISMFAIVLAGGRRGAIEADVTIGADGAMTITTEREVKGLKVIGLPRRIESARDLIEALTR